LHQLAFELPEGVLDMTARDAVVWARSWRTRVEETLAQVAAADPTDDSWIAELAAGHVAEPDLGEPTASEIDRLALMFARLGPLALSLPWRNGPPAKA
jgi:hypothetical protein